MRDLHAVRTPENVVFEFELAGLASRALALTVDVCVMAALVGLAAVVSSVFGLVLAGLAKALYFVALFAIQWGYGAVLEWRWLGQTVGKRIAGTRVLSADGLPISFGQAALRNLLRVLDILPGAYLLGGACVLWDARARRFGDIAADTIVVRAPVLEKPVQSSVLNERYNSLAQDGSLAAVAASLSAVERELMQSLANRRERLPLPIRYELFSLLACHLEQRLAWHRPSFLSEERFVLNLLALVLQDAEPARGPTFTEPAP